jgi:hypothetical protein
MSKSSICKRAVLFAPLFLWGPAEAVWIPTADLLPAHSAEEEDSVLEEKKGKRKGQQEEKPGKRKGQQEEKPGKRKGQERKQEEERPSKKAPSKEELHQQEYIEELEKQLDILRRNVPNLP